MWLVVHENTTQKKLQEIKTCNEVFAFEKITGKPWLSIYSGKEPNYIMNEDHDYGEKMAEKFFKAFMEWYNKVIVDMKNIP